jgi:hypothetical protein
MKTTITSSWQGIASANDFHPTDGSLITVHILDICNWLSAAMIQTLSANSLKYNKFCETVKVSSHDSYTVLMQLELMRSVSIIHPAVYLHTVPTVTTDDQ